LIHNLVTPAIAAKPTRKAPIGVATKAHIAAADETSSCIPNNGLRLATSPEAKDEKMKVQIPSRTHIFSGQLQLVSK
jgi:hypothetical protein